MSALNNSLLLGQEGGGGYSLSRSLRFNSSDSAYLSRTPASAGNRKTWTWAGWVKRTDIASSQRFYGNMDASGATGASIQITAAGELRYVDYTSGGTYSVVTSSLYRDPAAWYHIVVALDTTQATASNRIRLYVNGVQVTSFITANYHPQNATGDLNQANQHGIGRPGAYASDYFSGLLADIHFIDGQALDPTSFGEFSATTGVWMPKQYTGTYGTNGFHLDFSNNASAAALGTDVSGAGNTWSVNNLSVTAGAGNDSLVDVPTNGSEVDTGLGGQVRGNYCTLNPLDLSSGISLSNGNLDAVVASGANSKNIRSTIFPSSGKWYWEMTNTTVSTFTMIGIASRSVSLTSGYALNQTGGYSYGSDGYFYAASSADPTPATFTSGDVIGCAWDIGAGTLQFYKNGSSQGTISSIPSGEYSPAFTVTSGSDSIVVNFGARSFAYTAPSGFKALCTANLPAPVVTKPSTVMDVLTWSGNNAATRAISGLNHSPDLVWIKCRSDAAGHNLYDTVRTAGKLLSSDTTAAETTNSAFGYLSQFDSAGFTLTAGTYPGYESGNVNMTGRTYVGWTWDAGSSTVTNTAGSISSQVRANASAGFSVVTYTGNATNGATVGHGLGVAPAFFIIKKRSATSNWTTYHQSLGAGGSVFLNLTDAYSSDSTRFNNTAPSSTVVTLGAPFEGNTSGATYVMYCFAPVAGYASAFSYSGNGSTDGPMVYLGFRPALIILKRTDSANDWGIFDNKRLGYNPQTAFLFPNASYSESASDYMDLLSNGFKIRRTNAEYNASGGTKHANAWAESPFQYARAR